MSLEEKFKWVHEKVNDLTESLKTPCYPIPRQWNTFLDKGIASKLESLFDDDNMAEYILEYKPLSNKNLLLINLLYKLLKEHENRGKI